MQNIVNVGDIVTNVDGLSARITSVDKGNYGLLLHGEFIDVNMGFDYATFLPYELQPPDDDNWDWYGWPKYSEFIAPNGMKVGQVSIWAENAAKDTVEYYDKKWQQTMILMNKKARMN